MPSPHRRPPAAGQRLAVVGRINVYAFQEAYGGGFAALYIIVAELALGKADGLIGINGQEAYGLCVPGQ